MRVFDESLEGVDFRFDLLDLVNIFFVSNLINCTIVNLMLEDTSPSLFQLNFSFALPRRCCHCLSCLCSCLSGPP